MTKAAPNKRISIYFMSDKKGKVNHGFLVGRRNKKGSNGRYVLAEEFCKFGVFWPNKIVANRDDLALQIGKQILAEVGV